MSRTGLSVIAAVAVLSLLVLGYLAVTWNAPAGTTTVEISSPVETIPLPAQEEESATTESRQTNSVLPRIRFQTEEETPAPAGEPTIAEPPVEVVRDEMNAENAESDASPDEPAVQLPDLNSSDAFLTEEIRGLGNGGAVVSLLAEDQLIRKFVVFVENISRGDFPQTGLPYKALGQEMPVSTLDENLYAMDEAAHSRFDAVVDTLVALDTDAAMALYRLLSPLFQRAYAEIGFRNSNFDETLERAINNVLDMAEIEGPYQLVKPSVMYLYADASIENRQEVHKQLIRIGPENTVKLKAKLQEYLTRL